mmetsp:Transcript_42673/g.104883  ORF Transcript_42673/g.104883 Transcript_42673/m.104883 type:complete len:293 (-) Transcript_42673:56-934(-)
MPMTTCSRSTTRGCSSCRACSRPWPPSRSWWRRATTRATRGTRCCTRPPRTSTCTTRASACRSRRRDRASPRRATPTTRCSTRTTRGRCTSSSTRPSRRTRAAGRPRRSSATRWPGYAPTYKQPTPIVRSGRGSSPPATALCTRRHHTFPMPAATLSTARSRRLRHATPSKFKRCSKTCSTSTTLTLLSMAIFMLMSVFCRRTAQRLTRRRRTLSPLATLAILKAMRSWTTARRGSPRRTMPTSATACSPLRAPSSRSPRTAPPTTRSLTRSPSSALSAAVRAGRQTHVRGR